MNPWRYFYVPELVLILIRSVTAFLLLLIMTRIMGKKQLSQLTFFDYCVGITIGSVAATMSVDQNVKITNGFIALIIWGLFPIVLAYIGIKSRKFISVTDGRPAILIKNGHVLEDIMKSNQLSIDELMMLLREKDVFSLKEVEMAVLETNGKLSILKKAAEQPVTPQVLGLIVEKKTAPTLLIADGSILEKNVQMLHYSKTWLEAEVKKHGASSIKDVFLAQVDASGILYVDLYEEKKKKNKQKQEAELRTTLYSLEKELQQLSLQISNNKQLLGENEQIKKIQQAIQQIFPLL